MTAWTRSRTPSFRKTFETCVFTVVSLTTSLAAISALERPLARSWRISASRPVSEPTAAVSFSRRVGRRREAREQSLDRCRAEEGVPACDDAYRVDELSGTHVLQEEPTRSGSDGSVDVFVKVERCQHEDTRAAAGGDDLLRGLDPIEVRHSNVEEDHIRFEFLDESYGSRAVFGFADDLQVRPALDDQSKPAANERLVVGDRDPDAQLPSSIGISAVTPKPPPSAAPAVRAPPRSASRSRIPIRPFPP